MQYISAVHVCRGSPPVISAIQSDNTIEARLGIDSHADISCAGKLACIIEMIEGETCTVHPFNDSMKPMKNVQTVNVAYATDTPQGQTYILRVNYSLDFTLSMSHSILCTNQARSAGVIIDDVPKSLDSRGISSQSVIFPDLNIHLDIAFNGPVPYLPI